MSVSKGFGVRFQAALVLAESSIEALATQIRDEQRRKRVSPDYKLSTSTLARISRGERAPTDWEIELFSRLLGTPEGFLRHGFGDPATEQPGANAGSVPPELRQQAQRLLDELHALLDPAVADA